ncbi:DUF72 domain-containing protein [Pedobacter sp. MC2016-15]|uniref:DUF72 domain-containing protein n=1 Tax=Pedobacter sp. MC2016-15 TaxID=2994473 RepID=UPI002245D1BC|nr:DUF72 domain-containing protein [Pedobacter sp. MC2016-15]MCX2479756.1 DUF72 domain-containing protein [Pedobacter sp. MC2016-15]
MEEISVPHYYSGTSGLLLPVRNKSFYPPEFQDNSRLHFYGSLMNSIEINSSFYKLPMPSTVEKWAAETPDDFKFSFKLFREITHHKSLAFDPALLKRFIEVVSRAGTKKGCLLVQLPPSVRFGDVKQLMFLMDVLRENDPDEEWKIALEFRHISLYHEEVYEMLGSHRMAMVIQDKPPAATPLLESDLPFVYLRFHGPDGSYRGSYEQGVLEEYAVYIAEWLQKGKTVYTYFNNTMGDAVANLYTLRDLLKNYV